MNATFDVALPRSTVPPRVGWFSFVLVCNVAGFVGPALVGAESLRYAMLERPAFAPPWWIFAPVWIALYTLMGTATYLVWRRCTWERQRTAMRVLAVQLALHAAWTPVFFGLGQIFIAFLLLIASWLTVGAMTLVYACRVPLAGALLLPLWIWVWFAMVLNGGIWWLNRSC
jgi:tryptophan-rich sensory protein